jgi:hypothetical protein
VDGTCPVDGHSSSDTGAGYVSSDGVAVTVAGVKAAATAVAVMAIRHLTSGFGRHALRLRGL